MLPVEAALLLLARKAVLGHEGHLGAEQPDALGAAVQRRPHLTGETDVHPQRDAEAIEGHALEIPDLLELLGKGPLAENQRLVVLLELRRRIEEHLAVKAVHDERLVFHLQQRQVHRAHDRGDVQRLGQDGHVRGDRAPYRHDPAQLFRRDAGQHPRRDLVRHQDAVVRKVRLLGSDVLQVGKDPEAEILDVGPALPEIRILEGLEAPHVLVDHPF